MRSIPINPVLGREITERMRGVRAMIIVTVYLSILTVIVALVYSSETDGGAFAGPVITRIAGIGQGLFEWVLFFMVLLVLFLVPGFTSGAIAGERERQTLLPLQVTLLRPASILFGKLASSLVFTLLLLLATLPLLAVAYLIGGVTMGDALRGLGMLLFIALAVACITIACSTFVKRVQTATVLAYGIVLSLAGGTVAAFLVARQVDESRGFDTVDPPTVIMAANPIAMLADVAGESPYQTFNQFDPFGSNSSDAPLTNLRDLLSPDVFSDGDVIFERGFAADVAPAIDGGVEVFQVDAFGQPVPASRVDGGALPLWAEGMLILGGFGAFCFAASTLRLRTPARTER